MKVLRSGRRPYILLIMTLLLPGDISRPKLAQTDITRRPETHQISSKIFSQEFTIFGFSLKTDLSPVRRETSSYFTDDFPGVVSD